MSISLEEGVTVVARDSVLWREGDSADFFYLIRSGNVLLFKIVEARVIPLHNLGAGSIVGEEECVRNVARECHAVCTEDVEVVQVPSAELGKFLKGSPAWVQTLMETLTWRLHMSSEILAEHKISSSHLLGMEELTPQKEVSLKKLVE